VSFTKRANEVAGGFEEVGVINTRGCY
jgi:hypothetical protein